MEVVEEVISPPLEIAVIDRNTGETEVKLAIAGRTLDEWYPMGKIEVL